MKYTREAGSKLMLALAASLLSTMSLAAQQPEGPQSDAPPAVAPRPAPALEAASREKVIVPAGTRVGVVLQQGVVPGDEGVAVRRRHGGRRVGQLALHLEALEVRHAGLAQQRRHERDSTSRRYYP